jgi:putative DNA primase/helicase
MEAGKPSMISLKILQGALGGEIVSGQLLTSGPGHSRRDRSLAVKLTADGGFIVHSHAGDDWRDCQAYVRQMLGWPQWQPGDGHDHRVPQHRVRQFDRNVIDTEDEPRPYTEDELVRIRRAQTLWADADDPRGTLAETYLRSRALVLTDDVANSALRFHLACPWRDENTGEAIFLPALVAVFRSIDDDTVTAIQRIALTEEGTKRGRMMLGVVRRAAIKLDPAGETLAIGEGVETCMAARQLGYSPVWALCSTSNISRFLVIDGIQCLQILGEMGAASARAIELCAERWHAAGRKVQTVMPDDGCSDLNDELMAMAS